MIFVTMLRVAMTTVQGPRVFGGSFALISTGIGIGIAPRLAGDEAQSGRSGGGGGGKGGGGGGEESNFFFTVLLFVVRRLGGINWVWGHYNETSILCPELKGDRNPSKAVCQQHR